MTYGKIRKMQFNYLMVVEWKGERDSPANPDNVHGAFFPESCESFPDLEEKVTNLIRGATQKSGSALLEEQPSRSVLITDKEGSSTPTIRKT